MKSTVAFFDVDETLIKIKTMFHFYKFWCYTNGFFNKYRQYVIEHSHLASMGVSREELNKIYYRQFKGVDIDDLYHAGKQWFSSANLKNDFFISSSVEEFKKHKDQGHRTAFVSGSMLPLLQPIGQHLGVDTILCTKLLLTEDNKLTGEIGVPQTIGEGKKDALLSYLYCSGISQEECFCYGDDLSDIPMLSVTGNPICVGENTKLAEYARRNSWRVIAV